MASLTPDATTSSLRLFHDSTQPIAVGGRVFEVTTNIGETAISSCYVVQIKLMFAAVLSY